MSVFDYTASNGSPARVQGTIVADSAREAREKLRANGLMIESIRPQAVRNGNRRFARPGRYAGLVASAVRDLATLLTTGIGLVEALDTLTVQYRGKFQSSLLAVRQRVAGGMSLSESMAADPSVFDELTIQMVRVGENAGTLDAVLDQLADFRDRFLLFKDRVTTALMYPAIVMILAVGVSIFLMTVVLPMLLENLVESGRPLPWPTQVLKTISDAMLNHGIWILLAVVAVIALLAAALKTTRGKRLWHRTLFALPILGSLARKQEIARMSLIISALMTSGIVFVEAARIAGRSTKNILLRDALDNMVDSVQAGRDIADSLQGTGAFPPLVVQIFSVGQQTGRLEEMLDRLAAGYDRQVANATARLTSALEPILIVCLAIVVGFILFATILPILEAGNAL